MAIQTVTGILSKKDAGIMTPHEHIFIELTAFFEERELKDCESPSTAPVTMDKLGILNRDPYALKDNLRMNDYETQKKKFCVSRKPVALPLSMQPCPVLAEILLCSKKSLKQPVLTLLWVPVSMCHQHILNP